MTAVDTVAVLVLALVVVGLAVLAWSLLTDDEHLADVDDDEDMRRAGEAPW